MILEGIATRCIRELGAGFLLRNGRQVGDATWLRVPLHVVRFEGAFEISVGGVAEPKQAWSPAPEVPPRVGGEDHRGRNLFSTMRNSSPK